MRIEVNRTFEINGDSAKRVLEKLMNGSFSFERSSLVEFFFNIDGESPGVMRFSMETPLKEDRSGVPQVKKSVYSFSSNGNDKILTYESEIDPSEFYFYLMKSNPDEVLSSVRFRFKFSGSSLRVRFIDERHPLILTVENSRSNVEDVFSKLNLEDSEVRELSKDWSDRSALEEFLKSLEKD